jgi:hypothetical protein
VMVFGGKGTLNGGKNLFLSGMVGGRANADA